MYEERLASHSRNQNNSSLTKRNLASLLCDSVLAGMGGSPLCFQRSESLLSAANPGVQCVFHHDLGWLLWLQPSLLS